MKDPFPPPPSILTTLTTPLSTNLALRTLPPHIHELLLALCAYHLIFLYLSPFLSRRLFPSTYRALSAKQRINWNVHAVSMVQSLFINALALWVIWRDEERWAMGWRERVWGYTGATGMVQGFAAGYFCWDLGVSLRDVEVHGWGAVMHAGSAVVVSGLGFRPFLNYYGLNFVLYELSTPFLNVHWLLDKCGMTGSQFQLINGIALIASFGASRLVWGTYQSVNMYRDVWQAFKTPGELPVPPWLALAYVLANTILSGLNFWWFSRMVVTVRKRFQKPREQMNKKQ